MIAELFLILHHPKVIVVARAERILRQNLIIPATPFYDP